MKKSGQRLMMEAKLDCQRIAEGAFTPVVFERYELIGGEKGITLGYPTETINGSSCIVWINYNLRGNKQ